MAGALYYPPADRKSQDLSGTSYFQQRLMARIDGVVLHSTEGTGWPAYAGGGVAPQFTFNPQTLAWRQHAPANVAGRALQDTAGGVITNRQNIIQVEIIGTSGWATTENPTRTYTLADSWKVASLSPAALQSLGAFARWVHDEWGVPYVAPMRFGSWRGSTRMTFAQWDSFAGWCGHSHVPENDHSDPGAIDIAAVFAYAQAGPTKEDDMVTQAEMDAIAGLVVDKLGNLKYPDKTGVFDRIWSADERSKSTLVEVTNLRAVVKELATIVKGVDADGITKVIDKAVSDALAAQVKVTGTLQVDPR